jgi:hypothetical protein
MGARSGARLRETWSARHIRRGVIPRVEEETGEIRGRASSVRAVERDEARCDARSDSNLSYVCVRLGLGGALHPLLAVARTAKGAPA